MSDSKFTANVFGRALFFVQRNGDLEDSKFVVLQDVEFSDNRGFGRNGCV